MACLTGCCLTAERAGKQTMLVQAHRVDCLVGWLTKEKNLLSIHLPPQPRRLIGKLVENETMVAVQDRFRMARHLINWF